MTLVDDLLARIARLESQVKALSSPTAVPSVTIVDGTLKQITTVETGELDEDGRPVTTSVHTATLGQQPDGSTALVVHAGPVPPTPKAPTAVAAPGTLTIRWNGQFADQDGDGTDESAPADFQYVEAHAALTQDITLGYVVMGTADSLRGTIAVDGGEVIVGDLAPGAYTVALLTRTIAGVVSPLSYTSSATPVTIPSQAAVDAATNTANTAASDASTALSTANTASSTASSAATTAGTALSNAAAAQTAADNASKWRPYWSTNAPTGLAAGDVGKTVWFDMSAGNLPKFWNGSAWTAAPLGEQALAASSVVAGTIAAGAVNASHITAGAVTTSKLAVGDFTNYIANAGLLNNAAGWDLAGAGNGTAALIDLGGTPAIQVTRNQAAGQPETRVESDWTPIDPGTRVRASFVLNVTTLTAGAAYVTVVVKNTAGALQTTTIPVPPTASGTYTYEATLAQQHVAIKARLVISSAAPSGSVVAFSKMSFVKMLDGSLIVDGTLTTHDAVITGAFYTGDPGEQRIEIDDSGPQSTVRFYEDANDTDYAYINAPPVGENGVSIGMNSSTWGDRYSRLWITPDWLELGRVNGAQEQRGAAYRGKDSEAKISVADSNGVERSSVFANWSGLARLASRSTTVERTCVQCDNNSAVLSYADAAGTITNQLILNANGVRVYESDTLAGAKSAWLSSYTTSAAGTTYPDLSLNLRAPASGKVQFVIRAHVRTKTDNTAAALGYEMRTGIVAGSGTIVTDQGYNSTRASVNWSTRWVTVTVTEIIWNLTPGATYHLRPVAISTGTGATGAEYSDIKMHVFPLIG